MIKFDRKKKLFYLSGKSFSYVLWVDPNGYLINLHYGGRIGEDDLTYFDMRTRPISFSPIPPEDKKTWFSLDIAGQEYGSYAQGDFRSPSVIITRGDGDSSSRFQYLSHKVYKGVPSLEGMPHARKGGETLELHLKDRLSETEVILNYTLFEGSDILLRNAEIINCGKEAITLKRAYSFCVDLEEGSYEAICLQGRHCAERTPERTPIGHGNLTVSSSRGASSHQMNPFLALAEKSCTETQGVCFGALLIYSGSFALSAETSQTGSVRFQGGINDLGFSWKLEGGERFQTPQAVLVRTEEGLGQLSREYADFLRERILPPEFAYKPRPIVVNNWEATYFEFTKEKLCAIIDEAAPLGIDTFVLDDGWFGVRNDDTSGLGDWKVNETKLPGGLKGVVDYCKTRGLKFGLWFEPEMVSPDSDLYRAHPDWAIGKADVPRCTGRNQLILDMTRTEVVDNVFEQMSAILSAYDISYVKWDMNRHMSEFFSAALPADRQGEFAHRYILGVYSLLERLKKAFPKVFFEGCSGGGGRFDAGMLYYFAQYWTSDDTDAFERAKIQWGTSYCYPLSSMSCHVSVCPNHQTLRTTKFSARGAIASLGAFGYELDLAALSGEEKTLIKEQIKNYREYESLIQRGDLYRISNPFEGNEFCVTVVEKDKSRALVVGMQIHAVPVNPDRRLHLAGLDKERRYLVEELGITARGDTLMHAGVLLPSLFDFETWVWHIQEVKESD